jgi:hypothetical protein
MWVTVVSKDVPNRGVTRKAMPVDRTPDPQGLVEVMPPLPGVPGRRATVHRTVPMVIVGTLYTSHFATCPQADEWRGSHR